MPRGGSARPGDPGCAPEAEGKAAGAAAAPLYRSNSASGDAPPRPAKTAETVATAIVRDVVSRRLKPGDVLPSEAAMLVQYRVSRASLREALRLLEVQGLIRLKPGPGGGPVLGVVDPRNLAQLTSLYLHLGGGTYRQLFEAQLEIAPLVARMAAVNPDRDRVRTTLAPYLSRGLPVEGPDYWTTTSSFHAEVDELSGNRVVGLLARLIGHLWHVHVASRMDTTHLRAAIHDQHREIAKAIIAGQANKAGRLMRDHFRFLQAEYALCWPGRFEELIEWG
jgi:GntR family transcriptional repressor for pyruvate dehydrogenase complex